MKILYIPLDERPCNYKYPQFLSQMTDDTRIIVPPKKCLGYMKTPADIEGLWNWIFANVKQCSHAILSIDTLVYGNIINSRIHNRSLEECRKLMGNFEKVKKLNPEVEIHAFNLVTRVSNGNNDAEDPFYWKTHGEVIWKYCYLKDKINRRKALDCEYQEYTELLRTIPGDYMNDFLNRRKTNSQINIMSLEMVRDATIDYLVIPKDDCSEYGFAAIDQESIARTISEYGIMDRVMIHPGADEVGSVLLGRVFNRIHNYIPKVYIKYSSTWGPFIIPKYEDRPLHESIKSQITSLGGIIVMDESRADLLLAVHTPGKEMIEASDQDNQDVSNRSQSNIDEFLRYISYYSEEYGKPYAIADVAFANGADKELMSYANKVGVLSNACAYGGWNTAQNTIGVVIAQTVICSYYNAKRLNGFNQMRSEEFLLRKIIEDWFLQTITVNELYKMKADMQNVDYYNVGKDKALVQKIILSSIQQRISTELGNCFNKKKIILENLSLPWNRIFEVDFDLKLENYSYAQRIVSCKSDNKEYE